MRLDHDAYFRVMRLVEKNPSISQRQIASELGISLGGVNYCLNALIKKGHIKMRNFCASENKLGYVYLLTPAGLAQKSFMTRDFLARKRAEYAALKAEIESIEAELHGKSAEHTR